MKKELKNIARKTFSWHMYSRARKYARRNYFRKKGGIAFIGDSITEFMPIRAMFGKEAFNLGISGETSDQTAARFRTNCLRLRPRIIFLLVGTNDYHKTADGRTAENIRAMILSYRAAKSDAKFFVLSLLPINETVLLSAFRREQAFMDKTNAEIEKMLQEFPEVTILRIGEDMRDETGALNAAYTKDGLHPTYAGYLKMKERYDAAIASVPRAVSQKKLKIK